MKKLIAIFLNWYRSRKRAKKRRRWTATEACFKVYDRDTAHKGGPNQCD